MKVLRVVTLASATGKYGGPFDTALSQSRLTSDGKGTRSTFLAGYLPNDAPELDSRAVEVIIRRVRKVAGGTGFTTCISWKLCLELIRQVQRTDLVHVSYARELTPLLTALLAIGLRKPLVIQPHGMLTSRTSSLHRAVDIIARPVFRRASRIIALTDVEKTLLMSWSGLDDAGRFDVIGNPLPYEPRAGTATIPSNKAVFIARLEPRKRVNDFLDARRIAHARGWTEKYEVIGPDQGEGDAVRLAASQTPGLVYRGAVPAAEIDGILDSAGVFVLTSSNEPWGNVLVAAMVKGVPVVVTRSAALAGEIGDNHLGIVVPDRDPEAVAEAIHSILAGNWRTPEEMNKSLKFAKQRFNQLGIRKLLMRTYQSAISDRG